MIESIVDGVMNVICDGCGARMQVPEPYAGSLHDWLLDMASAIRCDRCLSNALAEEARERKEAREAQMTATLSARLRSIGIPAGMLELSKAPNAALGSYLWGNRGRSVVVGGASGVGKTTAAVACLHCLAAKRDLRARYCTLGALSSEWVSCMRGERGGVDAFWWRLGRLELLVVDEMVGRGGFGRFSPSTQEMVSGIVDRVYSGEMRAVWMIGNFHKGAWEEAFDEPQAVIRRLRERFERVWVEGDRVISMEVG